MPPNKALDALLGVAVGDAVGVPFGGNSRYAMVLNPATDMIGFEDCTSKGTWTAGSSLMFCSAQALVDGGYSLKSIAENFVRWKDGYWTAHDKIIDSRMTTFIAIDRLQRILADENFIELKLQKDYGEEYENGKWLPHEDYAALVSYQRKTNPRPIRNNLGGICSYASTCTGCHELFNIFETGGKILS